MESWPASLYTLEKSSGGPQPLTRGHDEPREKRSSSEINAMMRLRLSMPV